MGGWTPKLGRHPLRKTKLHVTPLRIYEVRQPSGGYLHRPGLRVMTLPLNLESYCGLLECYNSCFPEVWAMETSLRRKKYRPSYIMILIWPTYESGPRISAPLSYTSVIRPLQEAKNYIDIWLFWQVYEDKEDSSL